MRRTNAKTRYNGTKMDTHRGPPLLMLFVKSKICIELDLFFSHEDLKLYLF